MPLKPSLDKRAVQPVSNEQRLQELLKKIEADKKAIEDANKAAAQAAKERAASQLKLPSPDATRQQSNDRMEQKQLNIEPPQRPETVKLPTIGR